ncbi:hypothetical protein J6590_096085 [Homalodisca vitripennis]|nr:hypothetical protein J6590_096085 [Homalodisca vitripennis]
MIARGNMPRQTEFRPVSSLMTTRTHGHPPQPNWLDVKTLRTSILRIREMSSTPFRQIQIKESERPKQVLPSVCSYEVVPSKKAYVSPDGR